MHWRDRRRQVTCGSFMTKFSSTRLTFLGMTRLGFTTIAHAFDLPPLTDCSDALANQACNREY